MDRLRVLHPGGPRPLALEEIVRHGLGASRKSLPPSLFYDERGSRLFEEITRLPEYYVTRTEASILKRHADEIVAPNADPMVELGAGSAAKTRLLLDAATRGGRPLHYIAVDISEEMLLATGRELLRIYPALRVTAVVAEYARAIASLDLAASSLILFLGSSVGNFDPAETVAFFRSLRPADVPLLVGFDLQKDSAVLHAAYNDAAGVTARFNLNVLARLNRELGTDFDLAAFDHRAFYNATEGRIEMHLVSKRRQEVRVAGKRVRFESGEGIHTENSYKYTDAQVASLAKQGGFEAERTWTDDARLFSLVRLRPV
ncbi:MAG TPA: L-histidine N(alpha)-methyltransferase [Planctomycetota bacterium]|nr:L-histidine N(alpha)-methyltransferase [Planctomycetota bacterium]